MMCPAPSFFLGVGCWNSRVSLVSGAAIKNTGISGHGLHINASLWSSRLNCNSSPHPSFQSAEASSAQAKTRNGAFRDVHPTQ
ncbi:hypothetical protein PYCCODRAFT_482781 [Trametes coccinea BRFM310]|uniref:Uncharacterized protein n=1 Tax=Trametes coccinea (strain BRFM310) TaxID=1353009 RepID=A0A1Y2ILL4_TRAC3|nr:hypothetical protein PYCCODRAFT_482781 [Trametes coccinea BRFM310]